MVLITGATGTNGRLVVQGLRPHGAKAAHRGARDSDRLAAEGLVGGRDAQSMAFLSTLAIE